MRELRMTERQQNMEMVFLRYALQGFNFTSFFFCWAIKNNFTPLRHHPASEIRLVLKKCSADNYYFYGAVFHSFAAG
jgi:hypothetical protein